MKTMDIIQPKDNWGRGYAHSEYLWAGLHNDLAQAKKIEVKTSDAPAGFKYVCWTCHTPNNFWDRLCEKCDGRNSMEEWG